jgi:hypothetical protein
LSEILPTYSTPKKALFEEVLDEYLFLKELEELEPTDDLSCKDIESLRQEATQRFSSVYPPDLWDDFQNKAKKRVEERVEQLVEMKKVAAAKARLRDSLGALEVLHSRLKSGKGKDEALNITLRKRECDEALVELENAAKIIKQMK